MCVGAVWDQHAVSSSPTLTVRTTAGSWPLAGAGLLAAGLLQTGLATAEVTDAGVSSGVTTGLAGAGQGSVDRVL